MRLDRIKELEAGLEESGYTEDVRKAIRNARIGIVDDRIEDLKGLTEGLRNEGFTNVVEMKAVESVNKLLASDFDLLILDLVGIADGISAHDGAGVVAAIKAEDPSLPVLIVSGNPITATSAHMLARADLIRTKPILPAELAADVSQLLREKADGFWGGVAVLREIRKLTPEIREKLNWRDQLLLWFHCNRLASNIENRDPKAVKRLLSVSNRLSKLGMLGFRISKIAQGFGA